MTDSIFNQVNQQLLEPAGLTESNIEQAIAMTMIAGVDYADLYFQQSRQESWVLEDGIIKDGGYHIEQGVGVRACSGEKTGFAYSDDLILPALFDATKAARAIARSGQTNKVQAWKRVETPRFYGDSDPSKSAHCYRKVSACFTRRIKQPEMQILE